MNWGRESHYSLPQFGFQLPFGVAYQRDNFFRLVKKTNLKQSISSKLSTLNSKLLLTGRRWSTYEKIIDQKDHIRRINFAVAIGISRLQGRRCRTFYKQIIYQVNYVP